MPIGKIGETAKVEKKQRWVYKALRDSGLIIKKTTREFIRDGGGGAIDSLTHPPIKVHFPGKLLVVDENMGKRFNLEPEIIAKMVEAQNGFKRWYWCIESPGKVMTNDEVVAVEKALAEKDAAAKKGPKVVKGARGRRN